MSHSLKVGPTIPIFRSQNLVILEICDFLQGRVREVGGESGGGGVSEWPFWERAEKLVQQFRRLFVVRWCTEFAPATPAACPAEAVRSALQQLTVCCIYKVPYQIRSLWCMSWASFSSPWQPVSDPRATRPRRGTSIG